MLMPEISFHFRLRNTPVKFKHLAVLLVIILVILFYYTSSRNSSFVLANDPLPEEPDKFLSLKAEIGYLRQKLQHCGGNPAQTHVEHFDPVYAITPTYARPVQKAELTRLAQVRQISNIAWIKAWIKL